jgi:hypothetical protein
MNERIFTPYSTTLSIFLYGAAEHLARPWTPLVFQSRLQSTIDSIYTGCASVTTGYLGRGSSCWNAIGNLSAAEIQLVLVNGPV